MASSASRTSTSSRSSCSVPGTRSGAMVPSAAGPAVREAPAIPARPASGGPATSASIQTSRLAGLARLAGREVRDDQRMQEAPEVGRKGRVGAERVVLGDDEIASGCRARAGLRRMSHGPAAVVRREERARGLAPARRDARRRSR